MPSTYTTNNGIELIANGEQTGTWGDTTNDNLSIIDRLVTGVGSITLSGTTHTLTTTDGTLSDGMFRVLVFGGSPSGTNTVTISPNSQQKFYVVRNNSGQSIVLTQGSGGNVTVANGTVKLVYADGAGASAQVFDLTGTLAMTAPVLGTPASGTVTNLTGTASININGTVGATTPTTAVVTTLTANTSVSTDTISEKTSASGVTIDGVLLKDNAVSTDTINEKTSAAGVTVDGVLLKDGGATFTGNITLNAQSDVRFADADSSHSVGFQAASTVAANVTWTLPSADGTSGQFLSTNGSGTLSFASGFSTSAANTFTALQTFSGSTSVAALKLVNAKEVATVSATAATGTIAYDVTTQSVLYYTSNASANWTVNFRGSSGTSLDTLMSTGESITVAFLVTQGSTAYYNSAVQVDGNAVTPKWQGGAAPTAGFASSIDAYTYTIVKTGSATFTVFAAQTQFK